MVDAKLRKLIAAYCDDHGLEGDDAPLLFDNHAYDGSIVGITTDGRVVYDYETMITELMEDEGWSEGDAVEWLDYNTLRALPYAESQGGKAPVILEFAGRKALEERYGEEE